MLRWLPSRIAFAAPTRSLVGFVQADRGAAFDLLASRDVLLAGFHGEVPPTHLAAARLARVHLVRRQVGLAHAGPTLASVRDLAGRRLATRAPTAGVRAHFERALAAAGVTLDALHATATVVDSHREGVCAVLRAEADAALTTSAWAARVGLRFLPIAEEPYDLVLYAEHLGAREAVAVCEVAQSAAFREALASLAGYDPAGAGSIRYDFEDAPM